LKEGFVMHTLAEPRLIGDYEILEQAGSGGMGVVYKASQRSLRRVVALKVIRDEIACTPEYRDRFLREARLAASVDHPNIVSVYDVGEADGKLFLAMQWVDGEDLKGLLESSGRLSPERSVAIVSQLAGALDAVHSVAGLVHRDVKPANVLLRQVGGKDHAYLTDFGVAKPSEAAEQLTKTGWLVGTTGYLSPEQIMGREPGPGSDLYALGCLFFEALTGQSPFHRENEMALRWAHAHDPRPKASDVVPALGARYDGFLTVALAVDPEHRFASGREFAQALQTAHDGQREIATNAPVVLAHSPTAIGPPTPLPPAANTPPPTPPMYPGYAYATPPPGYPQKTRSGNPLALILLAIVALTGIAVGALAAGGVFSHNTPSITRTTTATIATRPTAPRSHHTHTNPRRTTAPPTPTSSTPTPTTNTGTTSPPLTVSPQTVPSTAGGPSRDASGYNTAAGCSDNPASPLPGCADSPSVPNGDPQGSCPNGITVDSQTTSCGLAENVYSNYTSDGPVTGLSPERGTNYEFNCQTGGPGTTGYTICLGQAGNSPLYLRWHQ
jgi:serine/threonine protein kinase